MKLTKCPNKHFYDADKYPECPHCNEAPPARAPVGPSQRSVSRQDAEAKQSTGGNSRKQQTGGGDRTGSIWTQAQPAGQPSALPADAPQYFEPASQTAAQHPVVPDLPEAQPSAEPPPAPPPVPLQEAVAAVVSHQATGSTEDVKTMAFYDLGGGQEPVVGWLVCIKGAYFGQSFNLKTGRNNVGRAGNMDIVLAQEPTVSRNRHAVITYEPSERKFFIQPGESSGLTYRNKAVVMQFEPLQAYDRVRLGNAEFIFVPCCGEQFSWEDYVS